ncbi:M20/M25/M40 family metallo-hydrolase [Castellaniella sp. S9]|uniref:M20/M25/M40 family metallo-hydrolase n=1 Tax=Castellaniella sp. S9 TaxID=2993652 RepID=UPI0022B48301|nr:M20/M25/M40 family metallo-hydrolase [Castellaniella sp. S9]
MSPTTEPHSQPADAGLRARLRAWVDAHFDEQVELLRTLVAIPTDTPPGDTAPHADAVARIVERWGWEVERHPVPEEQVRAYGMRSITNLIVRRRYAEGGPVFALNAHGDVVPPGEGWTHPPYGGEIADGRIYGRAAAVSKSDFTTYLHAVRALEASGAALAGTIELHFTYDEEFGGLLGPGWLLEQGLTRPDYALCAGFSYAAVTAHNGCLQFEVTIDGKATHGSMPKSGHDALRAAARVLDEIYRQADALDRIRSAFPGIDSPTMIVGRIDGGTNTNVVPGRVVLKMDRRMIPEEDPVQVEAEVRAFIQSAAAGLPGIRVDVRRILLAHPLRALPGHERIVASLRRHAEAVLGEPIQVCGTPLYADARLYGEHGVPVVLYGAGPRTLMESRAKQADENLALSDLCAATQVVALTLADFLAAHA